MTPCDDRIPALVDAAVGELAPAARAALEAHVAACPGCRAELASLTTVDALLVTTRHEPDPLSLSGFAARTADAAERFRDRSARGLWWSLPRAQRFASLFSAGALAAAVALFAARPPEPAASVDPAPLAAVTLEDEEEETEEDELAAAAPATLADSLAAADLPFVQLDLGLDTLDEDELEALIDLLEAT